MNFSEWNKYKLGELADITSSKRIFLADYTSVGIPFYRSKEIIQKSLGESLNEILFISEERYSEIKNKYGVPQNGDILISAVGERAGIPYVVKNDGDFYFKDGNLIWLRKIDKRLNSNYLYHWIKSNEGKGKIESLMIGSAQKALTIIGLKHFEICIPNIITQQRIASILCSLDDKIELNRQTNKTLEAITQTLFKETCLPKGEELPEGWNIKKLGDILESKGGTTPSTKNDEFWNGEYHWATPKDLSNLTVPVLLSTERLISAKGLKQISSGLLPIGTLLMSSRAPIGYFAISQIPVAINQGFIALNGVEVSNLFLLNWLKINLEKIKSMGNGSTFLEISKTVFRSIEIIVPNNSILNNFEEIANPIFQKIVVNERETQTLTTLRDSLLPKLMSGEIDVNISNE